MLIAEVEQKVNLTHLLISGFFLSSSLTPPPLRLRAKSSHRSAPSSHPPSPPVLLLLIHIGPPSPRHSHLSSFCSASPPTVRRQAHVYASFCADAQGHAEGATLRSIRVVYSRRLCAYVRGHTDTHRHTQTHTHRHTHRHARARARAHTHTHTHRGRVPPVAQAQEPAGKCQCQN